MYKLVVTTVDRKRHLSEIHSIENVGDAFKSEKGLIEFMERIVRGAVQHGIVMKDENGKLISFPKEAITSCTYVSSD